MRPSHSPTSSRQAPISERNLTRILDGLRGCHQRALATDRMVAEIHGRSGQARTLRFPT
jgi:hypothetical protein